MSHPRSSRSGSFEVSRVHSKPTLASMFFANWSAEIPGLSASRARSLIFVMRVAFSSPGWRKRYQGLLTHWEVSKNGGSWERWSVTGIFIGSFFY